MSNEEHVAEAIEHLQAAARELIAAARAVLDLADELVEDPGPLFTVLGDLVGRPRPERDDGAPDRAPRIQHIRVS